jgi:hypothetical protein
VVQEQNVTPFSTGLCVTARMAGVVIHKSSAIDVSEINLFQTEIILYSIFLPVLPQFQFHHFAVVYFICHPLEIHNGIIIKIIALPIQNK